MAGRPLGIIARAVLDAVAEQPMSARALAARLQCSHGVALKTCGRLKRGEQITVLRKVRMPGSDKPTAVYARALPQASMPAPSSIWYSQQAA